MSKLELANIPLSLYVHFPWCVKKCPYCDFNSHELTHPVDETKYINRLLADLNQDIRTFAVDRPISSIFMGGGTPSIFSAGAIGQLLEGINASLTLLPNAEITLEANPESSEYSKLCAYKQEGINRLSIGIQSFNEQALTKLGRAHSSDQAKRTVHAVKAAGFDNYNLDLMFGLPDQDMGAALSDLEQALEFAPPHLSLYQLTFEPNTVFYSKPPARADDDTLWQMQTALQQRITQAGYAHYEVSAYCKPNQYAQHNLNYWLFGDYLGIGAGAHSKVTGANGTITRRHKIKHPERYTSNALNTIAIKETALSSPDALFEALMNGLRLKSGVNINHLKNCTGATSNAIQQIISPALAKGLIEQTSEQIKTTELGFNHLDSLLSDMLLASEVDAPAG